PTILFALKERFPVAHRWQRKADGFKGRDDKWVIRLFDGPITIYHGNLSPDACKNIPVAAFFSARSTIAVAESSGSMSASFGPNRVFTLPGSTASTRMPSARSSTARHEVNMLRAALAILYG